VYYYDVLLAEHPEMSYADFFPNPDSHDEIMQGLRERSLDTSERG